MSVVIYLLALIGLVTVAVLCWKAFGPQLRTTSRVVGPDDDPEFLRRMSRRRPTDPESGTRDPQ